MILQLKDDVVVAVYTTAVEAAEKTGISLQGIRACAKEQQTKAGYFQWKRYDPPIIFKAKSGKVSYFKDIDMASDQTGDSIKSIKDSLKIPADDRWSFAPLSPPTEDFNPRFDIYEADIKRTSSIGKISLASIKDHILSPDEATRNTYTRIEIAELMREWEEKARLKSKLKFITPCVQTDGKRRSYAHVTAFTGLMHLDFDHIKDQAPAFRDQIFEHFPFVVGSWLSASRKGVKVLVRIPIVTSVPEFKEYYWGLHHIVSDYIGYDSAPQNAVLPLFLSHDPEAKFRELPSVWDTKGSNPSHWNRETIPVKVDYSSFEQHVVIDRAVRRIDSIEDNGHPQLRAAAYTLGGFIGAGYADPTDAEEAVIAAIERNDYLSKGTEGYIKTAKEMLLKGSKAPLDL